MTQRPPLIIYRAEQVEEMRARRARTRGRLDWLAIAISLVGLVAFGLFGDARAGTIAVPGLTGPDFSEESLVVVKLCGRPVAVIESTREDKTAMWVGMPMESRLGAFSMSNVGVNEIDITPVYAELAIMCQMMPPPGPPPKGA